MTGKKKKHLILFFVFTFCSLTLLAQSGKHLNPINFILENNLLSKTELTKLCPNLPMNDSGKYETNLLHLRAYQEWKNLCPHEFKEMMRQIDRQQLLLAGHELGQMNIVTHWFDLSQSAANTNTVGTDFPKQPNTGNRQKDAEIYAKAKKEWIKNNPEAYEAMGGVVPKKADAEVTNTKSFGVPIPADAEVWVLRDLKIIDTKNEMSAAELEKVKTAVSKELRVDKLLLAFGDKNDGYMGLSSLNAGSGTYQWLPNDQLEIKLMEKDCATCSKTLLMDIKEKSANEMILMLPDEDGWSNNQYILSFVKK